MEISFIGWIHTVLETICNAIIAIQRFISISNISGKYYVVATLITAWLMLYKNGGFNLAHLLDLYYISYSTWSNI